MFNFPNIRINIISMPENQFLKNLRKVLVAYFQVKWVQTVNLIFYFVIQILFFVFLTILPIKVTYFWLLVHVDGLNFAFEFLVLIIFISHIYFYLNYKLAKIVSRPQLSKIVLFKNEVVRVRWGSLITAEFLYDVACLGVAIFKVISTSDSLYAVLIELVYLGKFYKIKVFHDRFQKFIIGSTFYVVYNVFYGLFILVILVSYVGCIFYQIDYILYLDNYKFQSLLWINETSWNQIVKDSFGVQLLYAIYWSIGTATACVYGDISASAPPDVVYNIVCLYFQGFLFGFYISRLHALPANAVQKQNQLLEIFQQFQQHSRQLKRNGQYIPQQLYFKILCSLEYYQNAKQSLDQIQDILPEDYMMRIKRKIFHEFVDLNPMNLWNSQELQKKLYKHISEEVFEAGEMLYDYKNIQRSDLIYLKNGSIHAYLELDHGQYFSCHYNDGALVNTFGFITNLDIKPSKAKLQNYCTLYTIKRDNFKTLLSPKNYVYLLSLFNSMISFDNDYLDNQPIGLYHEQLSKKSSDVLLLGPSNKAEYFKKVVDRIDKKSTHGRQWFSRTELRSKKKKGMGRSGKINVAVQCSLQDLGLDLDKVFILDQQN